MFITLCTVCCLCAANWLAAASHHQMHFGFEQKIFQISFADLDVSAAKSMNVLSTRHPLTNPASSTNQQQYYRAYIESSVTSKNSPNVYKSCPINDFSRKNERPPSSKLPKNVGDLGKIIVATGLIKLPKVQYIAQSGHTDRVLCSGQFCCWRFQLRNETKCDQSYKHYITINYNSRVTISVT